MNHLKELPPDTVWPHLLEAIKRDVLNDIRDYAKSRSNDVARGAETTELAALLVDKYCDGMAKALHIVGIDAPARAEGDRLVLQLDPEFESHRKARWAAQPAALSTITPAAKSGERRIGQCLIKDELFESVRDTLQIGLKKTVPDSDVESFLERHQEILASIVGYDEVDTTDQSRIWDACKVNAISTGSN